MREQLQWETRRDQEGEELKEDWDEYSSYKEEDPELERCLLIIFPSSYLCSPPFTFEKVDYKQY